MTENTWVIAHLTTAITYYLLDDETHKILNANI